MSVVSCYISFSELAGSHVGGRKRRLERIYRTEEKLAVGGLYLQCEGSKLVPIRVPWSWIQIANNLASARFDTFGTLFIYFLNYIFWLRITDEGSVPEMRIWSILII